ncbi:hypothetical protein M8542_30730 [Amycolatopsis sp. OK19-0408]|uniref:Uncharacterized protein n=1 Tax=Amycolatopsis iheyensis TaxID=2945988 RepID=A0A9X2NGC0_9PSEU|nr:hypothetical protein [Amycolatopsis iheyensis]MCR6487213.1 hypothetical protein [Amycolatopsis iheyensis]
MAVREPALPVAPGEPTMREVAATRAWPARREVLVSLPTRLPALRVGARESVRDRSLRYLIAMLVTLGVGKFVLGLVPAARQALSPARPPLRETAKQVGGWYLSATAITFAGGVAGCVTEFLTDPPTLFFPAARTLGLAIGAWVTTLVLGKVLFGPVIAEDSASLAVDRVLRAQDAYRFAPSAIFAFLTVPDVPSSGSRSSRRSSAGCWSGACRRAATAGRTS